MTIQDPSRDLEMIGANTSPDGAVLWLTATARNASDRGGPSAFVAASVDSAGKVGALAPVSLEGAGPVAEKSPRSVLSTLGVDRAGRPWILISAEGTLHVRALIPGAPGAASPALTTKGATGQSLDGLPDGGWLIAGGAASDGYLAETDAGGRVAFEQLLSDPPLMLLQAFRKARGGWVAAGSRGIRSSGEEVWIGALDAKRQRVGKPQVYPGRSPSLAAGADGRSVLVFQQISGSSSEVVLKGFSEQKDGMKEDWSRSLFSAPGLMPPFSVAALPNGRFIVAGSTPQKGLWIEIVDAAAGGKAVWTESRTPAMPELELVGNVSVHSAGNSAVLAYSTFVLQGTTQRQVVKVLRIAADGAAAQQ